MMIIGVDYHPGFQEIAFLVEETGECDERSLKHSNGEAEKFYRDLKARGISAREGMETTGYSRWFERLLAELGFEVWIGDASTGFAPQEAQQRTALFGHSTEPLPCPAGVFPRDEPHVTGQRLAIDEPPPSPRNTSVASAVTGPTPGCVISSRAHMVS